MGESDRPDLDKLLRVLELNRSLGTETDPRALLRAILDAAVELLDAERGFILRLEDDKVRVRVARSLDRETIQRPGFKVSRTIAEASIHEGCSQLVSDAREDPRFHTAESVADQGLASVVCAPLRGRDGILGAIYLDHRFRHGAFGEPERQLLERFADQVALAVQSAELIETLEERTRQVDGLVQRLREENAHQSARLKQQGDALRRAEGLRFERRADARTYEEIVGESPAIQGVFALLDRVVLAPYTVLIEGESGTGKEVVARAIHRHSPRREAPFLGINCGALQPDLLESELFGHEKGAFTGAVRTHHGLFERADGGVLFLDEVGEMSPAMQTRLLRVLQEGEVRRVGSTETQSVSVRVIAATNRDLRALVEEGLFREDLYYRLNVLRIEMPPLRARMDDLPLLADHLLERIASRAGEPAKRLSKEALERMRSYDWPGNVRELENVLRQAVALHDGDDIGPEALGPDVLGATDRRRRRSGADVAVEGRPLEEVVAAATRRALEAALAETGGDKPAAAKRLGISRATCYRLCKQHEVE